MVMIHEKLGETAQSQLVRKRQEGVKEMAVRVTASLKLPESASTGIVTAMHQGTALDVVSGYGEQQIIPIHTLRGDAARAYQLGRLDALLEQTELVENPSPSRIIRQWRTERDRLAANISRRRKKHI